MLNCVCIRREEIFAAMYGWAGWSSIVKSAQVSIMYTKVVDKWIRTPGFGFRTLLATVLVSVLIPLLFTNHIGCFGRMQRCHAKCSVAMLNSDNKWNPAIALCNAKIWKHYRCPTLRLPSHKRNFRSLVHRPKMRCIVQDSVQCSAWLQRVD